MKPVPATASVTLVTNQIDKLGGLERYVIELAPRLVQRGFAVTVIAKATAVAPGVEERSDGVTVVRTWVPSKGRPWFAVAYGLGVPYVTDREVGRHRSSILHGHFFAPMLGPAVRRMPYIYTFHGPLYKELLDERDNSYLLPAPVQRSVVEATRRAERLVIDRARLVTVLSDFMRTELAAMGARPRRIEVLAGGVNTERFSPGPVARPDWTAGKRPLLLTTRRLARGKGVLELVLAMPAILRELPEALLAIAGSGAERSEIKAAVAKLNLGHAVRLLGDVSGPDLVTWYRTADLCVMPTQRPEPFGLSTVEALACGTPVVATPHGATPELLAPLEPRLVLEAADSAAMARGIVSLARDAELLGRVRQRARGHVHPRFSWDGVADRWAEIYRGFSQIRGAANGKFELHGPAAERGQGHRERDGSEAESEPL